MEIATNVRRPWSELTFVPQRRDSYQPKRLRPVEAIDTETVNGLVWLICDSKGRESFPSTWFEVLDWLEEGELYKTTLLCWNLDYDARAILALLDVNTLIELAVTNHFTQPLFSLTYVPRKFLTIAYNKHRYELFDLMQFFNSSLNAASKKYLDEEKIDLDARRISTDAKYRDNHRKEIIEYCKRDADLTARLGRLNSSLYQSIGVASNKWYSTGYIAAKYFLTHSRVPRYHFVQPQQYAYYSYAGGRFECFQRGYFEQAYKYDITSAYPYVISQLPNLDRGKWVRDTTVDYDADLIFARVRVTVPDNFVQPLHIKHKGVVLYPSTTSHYRIITKSELEVIDEFELATVDVCEAWHFYADSNERPFASIRDIFKRRLELRDAGDRREYVLKKVMNSLYGKFIQVTTELAPVLKHRVGNLFIPAYASEITARTRMQLLRTTLERDMTPIAYFTDAILTSEPEELASEGLGSWSLETSGELVLLGCGVYSFRDGAKIDTHLRGFESRKDISLFDLLKSNANKSSIRFDNERPISLGEFAHRNLAVKGLHLNEWVSRSKNVYINFDRKRDWLVEWHRCSDVFHGSHHGLALHITV